MTGVQTCALPICKTGFRGKHTKKGKSGKSGKQSESPGKYRAMPTRVITANIYRYMRRYAATANVLSAITIFDIFRSFIMAATTTLGYTPWKAIKLVKLEIWSPVTTQGTPVTVIIKPNITETSTNSYGDLQEVYEDTSMTFDWPAYIKLSPKKIHPSGSWHNSSNTDANLITVIAPIGSILDLYFEAIPNLTEAPNGFTQTLSGAVVGEVYARNVATNFAPVGINNI